MKTKKFNLLAVVLFFICNASYSQIWHFGGGAGIDFSGGSPVAELGGQTIAANTEGVGVQYDCNGDLLFYSDGMNVWDKNHSPLVGGLGGGNSNSQVLTLPVPGSVNKNEFYIFYGIAGGAAFGARLYYAIVDVTAGIIVTKDQDLPSGGAIFFEGMTLVAHSNGTDSWLVTHRGNANEWDIYLIDGVTGTDGVSHDHIEVNAGINLAYGSLNIGYMATSKNNDRIAYANMGTGNVEVFSFSNASGGITGTLRSWNTANYYYGIDFSPNGNYVYIGRIENFGVPGVDGQILQGDIAGGGGYVYAMGNYGAVRRGPDDKIYSGALGSSDLGVLNTPDIVGAGAGWDPTAIGGAGFGGPTIQYGLPTFPIEVVCPIVLSIELVSFTAIENKGMVDLNWVSASEENNEYFAIERSKNGLEWEELGRLSGMGTTSLSTEYNFSDENPYLGTSYYRLKQTDYSGKSKAFNVEAVHFDQKGEVYVVKANQNNVEIIVSIEKEEDGVVEIYNIIGDRVVRTPLVLKKGSGRYQISIPANLSEGIYLLKIKTESGFVKSLKFKF